MISAQNELSLPYPIIPSMKKLFFILFCLPLFAGAQNFHFSGRFGLAGYNGDLKKQNFTLSQTKLMGSIGVRYDLTDRITARSYISLMSLKADDKKGDALMRQRNLNFHTKLIDWELSAQYHLFSLNDRWWTPYVFAGIGLYHFNPWTKDSAGNKVFLQPLGTEGEGFAPGVKKYKKMGFSIPMGVGVSYALNEDMRLGLELGYRKTFSDHLDDVSGNYIDQTQLLNARGQTAVDMAWRGNGTYPHAGSPRGDPTHKDGYYYIALTYTVRYFFDKYKQIVGLPTSSKEKKVGCPSARGY
jgi:opacity protein-like surface antigen